MQGWLSDAPLLVLDDPATLRVVHTAAIVSAAGNYPISYAASVAQLLTFARCMIMVHDHHTFFAPYVGSSAFVVVQSAVTGSGYHHACTLVWACVAPDSSCLYNCTGDLLEKSTDV
jgi:hypothetical protein